jgi:hypothetical protein
MGVKLGRSVREKCRLRVSENRVLRRIFGPKRDKVTREWRKLHKEELNDLCSSPNIVQVIKSRRMRWAGNVARMGERRGVYRVSVGKPEGKNHLGDPGIDGKIILRWIYRKWDVMDRAGSDRDRWRAPVIAVMNLWATIRSVALLHILDVLVPHFDSQPIYYDPSFFLTLQFLQTNTILYLGLDTISSLLFFCGAATQCGSWPPHSWGF